MTVDCTGNAVAVGSGVLVGVFVGVLVGVLVGGTVVLVGVLVAVLVGVLVAVLVGVLVAVLVGVFVRVVVGVLVRVAVLVGVAGGSNSYAPLSQAAPCGRATPRWSVAGGGQFTPLSIAGLSDCNAIVCVAPPFS